MYVISSRPERAPPPASWAVLFSSNGSPPPNQPAVAPNYLPAGFVSSLVDHVVVFVHGYSNSEKDAFRACAQVAGLDSGQLSLPGRGFSGMVVGYDWPTGTATSINPSVQLALYRHDLTQAKNPGVPSFDDFL